MDAGVAKLDDTGCDEEDKQTAICAKKDGE